jgi:hypothetical protein
MWHEVRSTASDTYRMLAELHWLVRARERQDDIRLNLNDTLCAERGGWPHLHGVLDQHWRDILAPCSDDKLLDAPCDLQE